MNKELKEFVDKEFYDALVEISKYDEVVKRALDKSDTAKNFITSLMAAIICMYTRETEFSNMLIGILKSNPQVQEIIKIKNDPSLLSKESISK